MFDKLYKEANDEINVNTILLEKLKSEASKGEKRKSYSFMYKYGFAAAAIIIVAVSLNIMPDMKKNQEAEKRYPGTQEHTVMTDDNALHDETSESLTKEKTKNPENFKESEEKNNDVISSETARINDNKIITPQKKVQSEKISSTPQKDDEEKLNIEESLVKPSNNILTDKTNETKNNQSDSEQNLKPETNSIIKKKDATKKEDKFIESSDNVSIIPKTVETNENDNPKNESLPTIPEVSEDDTISNPPVPLLRSGGVGGNIYSETSSYNSETIISLEEYCTLFGFNPDNWDIPSDMVRTEGEEVYIQKNPTTGEYLKTNHTAIYSGNSKNIYITLLPDSDDVLSLINSGNGEIYKGNLILKNTDSSYTSYIVKNGNGYIVETNNLEKENVYSLIDSIG